MERRCHCWLDAVLADLVTFGGEDAAGPAAGTAAFLPTYRAPSTTNTSDMYAYAHAQSSAETTGGSVKSDFGQSVSPVTEVRSNRA